MLFVRNDSKSGPHRALCAILHIIDGELDLSLLVDQRVLKECYTAQEDGVTGPLQTERQWERERWMKEFGSFQDPTGKKKGKRAIGHLNDFSLSVLGPEGPGAAWCS